MKTQYFILTPVSKAEATGLPHVVLITSTDLARPCSLEMNALSNNPAKVDWALHLTAGSVGVFNMERLITNSPTYQFQRLFMDTDNPANNQSYSVHTDFMQAWQDMYEYVKERLDAGNMTQQELETSMWIEVVNGQGKIPICFYDARDKAIDQFAWKVPTK